MTGWREAQAARWKRDAEKSDERARLRSEKKRLHNGSQVDLGTVERTVRVELYAKRLSAVLGKEVTRTEAARVLIDSALSAARVQPSVAVGTEIKSKAEHDAAEAAEES